MKTEAVIGGVMIVVGVGVAAYIILKPKTSSLGSEFDHFTSYKVTDTPVKYDKTTTECKKLCLGDSKCTAFSYNLSDNSCILTHKDPFATAEETIAGQWQIYVRRPDGALPSAWGPWTPEQCPPCGETKDITQSRTCSGPKCLGANKHRCSVGACFDVFDGFRMSD